MGGQCEHDFTNSVTHLIASKVGSEKVSPLLSLSLLLSPFLSLSPSHNLIIAVQGRSRSIVSVLLPLTFGVVCNKCEQVAAKGSGGPIITTPDWVWRCWQQRRRVPPEECPLLPFAGCVIAVTGWVTISVYVVSDMYLYQDSNKVTIL